MNSYCDDDDETLIVEAHEPSLKTARKDVCCDGTPFTGAAEQVSEWATAYALSRFKIGQEISIEEFHKALNEGLATQYMNSMVDLGLADAIWDETIGEVVIKFKS